MKPLATVTRWQQAASHLSAIASCRGIQRQLVNIIPQSDLAAIKLRWTSRP